jgi:hypothetical protein
MAPTTRKQTPSTPTAPKNSDKASKTTLVTPDRLPKVGKSRVSVPVPKKTQKRNATVTDGTKDSKPAAISDEKVLKSRTKSERFVKDGSQPPPSKKIKAKPRTKTHSEEQINKFAALYKEIESTKPVASTTLSVSSAQQTGSYHPPQRICKAYTYGTFDGCAVYMVYACNSTRFPAYTINIRQQIENDENLMESLHILKMVNKRDPHNPFEVWRQPITTHTQKDGRIRYKYWPIYVRLFENSEDNTVENRKKWAADFTVVANDLAPTNVDGSTTNYPAIHIEYQSDMGQSHLVDYLTVDDVFFEIERRWIDHQAVSPDVRREMQVTKVLNDERLLTVFFGEDKNFLDQVKAHYRQSRGLWDDEIPSNVDKPEDEGDEDDEEDSDDGDENKDDSHGSNNDDDTDRSGDDSSRTNEECNIMDNKEQKENKGKTENDRNDEQNKECNVVDGEQQRRGKETVGGTDDGINIDMNELFKSVDRSM